MLDRQEDDDLVWCRDTYPLEPQKWHIAGLKAWLRLHNCKIPTGMTKRYELANLVITHDDSPVLCEAAPTTAQTVLYQSLLAPTGTG